MSEPPSRRPPSARPAPPGDADATRLFEELYEELRRLASWYMRGQTPTHTLQTTALVGEAYLKLARAHGKRWRSRREFMGVAARAMRCVLVDHGRERGADKRRAAGGRIHLDGLVTTLEQRSAGIAVLDDALNELERMGASGARAVRVVELRFFCGLTMAEIADALEMSPRSVERDWEFARTWLATRLK